MSSGTYEDFEIGSIGPAKGATGMSSVGSYDSGSRHLDGGKLGGRKPRADGVESRRTILLAAAELATTRGLEGLSIGELAQHIGMSKSGLYAHFKSKEELELATIETAAEIFERDVLGPAGESPRGLGRVLALSEAFLRHLERRVFPGGCFFATVAVQLAARPGRPHDRVMELQKGWLDQFALALGQAVTGGELPRDTDIDQLVFEITAMMVRANFTWIVTGETHVLEQARIGIRHVLERVARHTERESRSSERRATRARSRARA
jgi:AcrR family transcriptional regulator